MKKTIQVNSINVNNFFEKIYQKISTNFFLLGSGKQYVVNREKQSSSSVLIPIGPAEFNPYG